MAAAVEALKMGLKKDSPVYDDLVMTPCRNLDEVRNRALRYIRLKDDKKAHGNLIIPKYESTNRKSDSPQKFSRPKPYSKQDSPRINAEIGYLHSMGYLKELFGKNNNKSQDPAKIPEKAPSPPPGTMVVAFISGGSDIYGTSYSAAKKRSKETKMDNVERLLCTSTLTTHKIISFEEEDQCDLQDPHHDGLVITLCITNCFVREILIDGGSSVNIIQLDALKKMDIPETEIIPRSSVLIGFSGETKNTLGDIKLPVYIEGAGLGSMT
ncbi:uncharacterized protein LOC143616391 [Bidens hawaiensis]|uniref:uncharacterized protein LOC143616391 n=1 Tax=Bidens hawaiensis TaxID=980011 RepID=UPI0040495617